MNIIFKSPALLLVSAAALMLISCASTTAPQNTISVTQPGKIGSTTLETSQETAIVTAINTRNRTVTLRSQDGQLITYRALRGIVDINLFQIGQQVNVTVAEELAISVAKKGVPSVQAGQNEMGLQSGGINQGLFVTETKKVTAQIIAIQPASRKLTLRLGSGSLRTITIGPSVNLDTLQKGNDVVVQLTKAIIIHP